jgi:outer membrane lipoprotein-sorting protein
MGLMHRHGIVSALVLAAALPLGAVPQGLSAQAPAPGTAPAQDTAKGAALLAEARKAVGGEDKLAAVQRLEVKGQMRASAGNLNIDGDTELFFERPDKFKRKDELSLGSGGPSIERLQLLTATEFIEETSQGGMPGRGGFDGGGRGGFRGGQPGGQQAGGQQGQAPQIDPERLREAQRRNLQLEISRMLLAVLLTTDAPVAWIGTAQSPDGSADVLEITPAGGTPTRLLLDEKTHMPLMLTWTGGGGGGLAGRAGNFGRGRFGGGAAPGGDQPGAPAGPPAGAPAPGAAAPAPGGAPGAEAQAGTPQAGTAPQGRRGGGRGGAAGATTQMFLSDYKVVNGLKLPHLITRGANGETAEELVIKNYRVNPNFKADTFKK